MRVLVTGGREFRDMAHVNNVLDGLHASERGPVQFIFHGNARGADTLAAIWARDNRRDGVRNCPCPAEWAKHGKRAGPIRNQNMLGNGIDLVIAFPGGRGTADMVHRAKAAGVEVIEVPAREEGR